MPISDPIRGLALAALFALAGCGDRQPDRAERAAASGPAIPVPEAAAPDARIPCAQGQGAMERACTVEQEPGKDGTVLTVRNPDGGFHRFTVLADGTGVAAADGAEPARVSVDGQEVEIAIGGDRYRLPAQVGPVSRP